MKKDITIIGYGYVGKAMADFFKNHYNVIIYDPILTNNGKKRDVIKSIQSLGLQHTVDKKVVNRCDLAVVCVPTPRGKDGECDLSAINATMEWLDTPLILLKSTVEIGTTDALIQMYGKRIVFSPEYIGESSYYTPAPYDFHKNVEITPWFTFGGAKEDTTQMVDIFLPITGPVKEYVQCTASEAEMAKYMENSFYASKIMFMYEMDRICNAMGIDFNTVRELWLKDNRINPMHTAVFRNKTEDYCFGGKCLPKDISALIEASKKFGYTPSLLEEVRDSNNRIGKMLNGNSNSNDNSNDNASLTEADNEVTYTKEPPVNNKCVYTCITGGYDNLIEPRIMTPGWDYICFTDNKELKSTRWKVVHINNISKLDNTRLNRMVKIQYHKFVGEYDLSIYIDGNYQITNNLDLFMRKYANAEQPLVISKHPKRTCVYTEATACKRLNKDDANTIDAVMERYKSEGMPADFGLTQNGILIRKKDDNTRKFMELWWNEVKNNSKRDQLSFSYINWKYSLIRFRVVAPTAFTETFKLNLHTSDLRKPTARRRPTRRR
jgi:nucleotide sugar dehydrogenase